MRYDAAIVGGGIAGLQAALTLARGLHRVVVIDAAMPCNRVTPQMHGMIGADGDNPGEFYRRAHAQLDAYPNLTRVTSAVIDGTVEADLSFRLWDAAGAGWHATKVLFACGVRDVLPPVPGLAELWGKQVQHCAFCHGYEARGQAVGLLTPASAAAKMISMVRHLTPTIHLLIEDGAPAPSLAESWECAGITYTDSPLAAVEPWADGLRVHLADGRALPFGTLFIRPGAEAATRLPEKFGCTMEHGQIKLDQWGQTGIAGVYAAGDMATGTVGQLVAAMKSGLDAGVMMHYDLLEGR